MVLVTDFSGLISAWSEINLIALVVAVLFIYLAKLYDYSPLVITGTAILVTVAASFLIMGLLAITGVFDQATLEGTVTDTLGYVATIEGVPHPVKLDSLFIEVGDQIKADCYGRIENLTCYNVTPLGGNQ